jgi:hypothetical protein
MSEVIKFLKRLFLFLIVLIVVDYSLGFLLETAYFSQKKGQFAQTTYAVDSTKQDILIFGSSRAVRHYSPSIIGKALNMSCYNVGRDAQLIPYYAAIQEATLKRYKPKLIIVDVNSWELSPGEGKYEKLSILLPYCRRHPELRSYVEQGSKQERLKLWSRIYPYNSSLFVLGYNSLFPNKVASDDHGYVPLTGEMTDLMLKDHMERMKTDKSELGNQIDPKALAYYTQFLSNTTKYGIKTYVIISPKILKEPMNFKVQRLMDVASKFSNVKFINFSADPKYNFKYEMFADVFHLNQKGAEAFSKDLISHLN